MITSVSKIMKILNQLAPFETAEPWDNVGLIIGSDTRQTSRILLALDLSDAVIKEAIAEGIDLIITHHPAIFTAIKSINNHDPVGKKIIMCIENGINVIAAHTNLDKSLGSGINKAIGNALNLENMTALVPEQEGVGFGVIGKLPEPIKVSAFIHMVKMAFNIDTLKMTHFNEDAIVNTIAISSGASADFIQNALDAKSDVFITGDLKYHEAQRVENQKMILMDVGHFESEVIYLETLKKLLDEQIMTKGYDVMTMVSELESPVFYHV